MLEEIERNEVFIRRFQNYVQERLSLEAKLNKKRSGIPPEKQKNREGRLRDLKERLIPRTVELMSKLSP